MKFIQNKYTTWYNNIIHNAQNRCIDVYTENHHIIPRSLDGSDDESNLIRLTAKEHFICHLLLTKMTKGNARRKMLHAAWCMANLRIPGQERYKVSSGLYEIIKTKNAKALSEATTGRIGKNKGRVTTPEWREKLRQAGLGKKRSKESCAKQAATMTGRKRSQEECEAISNGLKGRVSPTKGLKFSDETRAKMSAARKAYHAQQIIMF